MGVAPPSAATRLWWACLLLLLVSSSKFVVSAFVATQRGAVSAALHNRVDHARWTSSLARVGRHRADTTMVLSQIFGAGKKKDANAADRLSVELYNMLTDHASRPDDDAVIAKIEALESAPGLTFDKANIFDGNAWRVLWKTNTAWQRYFDPFNSVSDNRAYQKYGADGGVTNIAQALGGKLYVTVDGQGVPASKSTKLPYEVNVDVSRGWLHAFGIKLPLDFIKGRGTTFVVYSDPKLRVFRSDTGGVVVQTKADEYVPT